MLVLTYVFRICPTRIQHAAMQRILDSQRHLYNAALEERIAAWRRGVSISLNDQTRSLTEVRQDDPFYGRLPYNVSKWTLKRLDDAMKAFFRRAKTRSGRVGFPRFRSSSRWSSFGFHQKDGLRLRNHKLYFSGGLIGGLDLKLHRSLPAGAVIKSAIFTRQGRHWKVALAVTVDASKEHQLAGAACGVDVGIERLASLSDGTHIQNVRPRRRQEKMLRRAARALARCQRGSKRRRKVRARLAKIQRQVRNHRTTHLHQVSAVIAREHAFIAVEDLNLTNMTRSAKGTLAEPGRNVRQKTGLNRSLLDAAPGRLISMLRYKAARAGGVLVGVDPKNTSQECSYCGAIVLKKLSDRRHVCCCGADLHRDHNAAINILKRGLAAHRAARGPGEHNVVGCDERAPRKTDLLAA